MHTASLSKAPVSGSVDGGGAQMTCNLITEVIWLEKKSYDFTCQAQVGHIVGRDGD